MALDWTSQRNESKRHPKSRHEINSSREKKERSTKRELAQVSGEGDEKARSDMGPGSEIVKGQAGLAFFGDGLMCLNTKNTQNKANRL